MSSLYFLFDSSTTDPGFIPKGNMTREDFEKSYQERALNTTENPINTAPRKYCDTCKIERPSRSFHCSICGNCVSIHGIVYC